MENGKHYMTKDWDEDVLKFSGDFALPEMTDKEQAWIKFSEKLKVTLPPCHPPIFDRQFFYQTAASALLIATVYYLVQVAFVKEYMTPPGRTTKILLPDNSKVTLNAGSRLKFNPVTWDIERKIQFEGEGFFEITTGGSLEIVSANGVTRVLGTSVNINTRHGYEVFCFAGAVEVAVRKRKAALKSGERFLANHDGLVHKGKYSEEKAASWLRGEFYFESQPAEKVFQELERQFNIDIAHPDLSDSVYSGYFSREDLHQALEMVCFPLGLTYHRAVGRTIVVKRSSGA